MSASTRALGRVERLMILRTFQGFAHMEPAEVSIMAELTRKRFFPTGSVIARGGEPSRGIHFIVHGKVELHRHGHLLARFGERSTIGGLNLLARDPDTPEMVATEDTITLEIRGEDMEDVFEDNFHILLSVCRAIARGILDHRRELGPSAGFVEDESENVECPARPLDLVERVFFLRQSMLFARTRIEALAQLARHAEELRLERGTVLWREGDEPTALVFPICGRARAYNAAGQSFYFRRGGSFGGLANLADRPCWVTVEIDEPMVALKFDREIFLDVLEDHLEMARDFLGIMASGLIGMLELRAGHAPTAARMATGEEGATSAPALVR